MNTLLAVAPNGARKSKENHPAIPLTAEEIGLEAKVCMQVGAGMIHLHVRNKLGLHSLSADYYQQAIEQIKIQTNNGILIQVTTEAVGKYSPDEQFGMIHALKPGFVSIALREMKKMDELDVYENFNLMREENTCPQIILYNHLDVSNYLNWLSEGILPGNSYPVLLVLGKSHAAGSFELDDLDKKPDFPASSIMVCAFGEEEFVAGKLAVGQNWHVRIGFENNELLKNGETAKNNAELISQMADHVKANNKKLATAKDAKTIMTPDW